MKKVNSLDNGIVLVDETKRKLLSYDNDKKRAIYNAPIIKNGKTTIFCADYVEEGIVTDIEERLNTFGSPIKSFYATLVNFDSDKYDPENKIWNIIINYIKEHEDQFFFKNGNIKKRIIEQNLNIVLANFNEKGKKCGIESILMQKI